MGRNLELSKKSGYHVKVDVLKYTRKIIKNFTDDAFSDSQRILLTLMSDSGNTYAAFCQEKKDSSHYIF